MSITDTLRMQNDVGPNIKPSHGPVKWMCENNNHRKAFDSFVSEFGSAIFPTLYFLMSSTQKEIEKNW